MNSPYYYKIAVKAPLFASLTYASEEPLSTGQRVQIPLGSKTSEGVVLNPDPKGAEVKKLKYVLGKDFLLDSTRLKWLQWLSSYYYYPLGLIAALSFPPLKEKTKTKTKLKTEPPSLDVKKSPLSLTPEQNQVIQDISKSNHFQTHLLYGVTGSGKTEVYKALTKKIIDQKKQVLILVPEIFLIPQIANKFSEMFTTQVALLHSKMTPRQKTNEWWDLIRKKKNILIGTRSALFCPLPNLGLIIVDEEHEESFKQDKKFRYHARDSATMYAKMADIPIVLGSATPHLSTWFQAQEGNYFLHQLKKRASNQALPSVTVVDLRKSKKLENSGRPFWLSEKLYFKIKETLAMKKQVALFLNRRGQASALMCLNCGFVKYCPNCEIALTLHRSSHLLCHYCDYSEAKPRVCSECDQQEWIEKGLGTEKVEQVIKELFPDSKVLRADRDAIDSREEMENFIHLVEKEEVDIVIGTQMLSKGLDFGSLQLVGLLLADMGFHFPDFRAGERTFQTLLQMGGRAGRKEGGEVILQTFNPEHKIFQFAKNHDYESFASLELENRKELNYPPFCRLGLIHVTSLKQEKARRYIAKLGERIRGENQWQLKVLGPSPSPLFKIRNQYRFQILIKSKSHKNLQSFLDSFLSSVKTESQVQMRVDRDPMTML